MPMSTTRIALPSASPGTERTLRVHRYGTPGARPKAYVQATLMLMKFRAYWLRNICCAGWNRPRWKGGLSVKWWWFRSLIRLG